MYTVIRRYKTDPSSIDEIVRRAGEGFVPIISSAPGFVSYRILDAGNGELITVSVFEDQAGGEASVSMAAGWVRENLASLVPNPPEVTGGQARIRQVSSQVDLRYGVMRRYKVDPAAVDEIARRAAAGFVPIVSSVPGFAAYQLVDAGNGVVVTLSGFADRAGVEASTSKAAGWVKENLASLAPNPPEVTYGEVKVSKVK